MCLKNIISSDEEYAHQRADNHKRLMREQREGWDGKTISTISATLTTHFNTYEIKDDNNEINN